MKGNISSSSSMTSELTISVNTPLINCADFNVNGNITKNSAESLDDVGTTLWRNINTPILLKHGQSNTEL